jgi:hypothetical protein
VSELLRRPPGWPFTCGRGRRRTPGKANSPSTHAGRLVGQSVVSALLVACAANNAQLDSRLDAVAQQLLDAEASGARQCAPRHLAVARSHVAFAGHERSQGYASRAEQHLDLAEWHARAALMLSPARRCADDAAGNELGARRAVP